MKRKIAQEINYYILIDAEVELDITQLSSLTPNDPSDHFLVSVPLFGVARSNILSFF